MVDTKFFQETICVKDIATVDWGNTNLTKSSYEDIGEFLAVSATGVDGRINHYEHEAFVPVISAIGALCGKMMLPNNRFTAIKNTLTVTPKKDLADGKFLYFLLSNIQLPVRGGAQPFISKGDIEKLRLAVPDINEQIAIAEALSDIDDLIRTTKNELSKMRNIRMSLLQSLGKLFSTTTPLSMILDTPVTDGPHLTPKFLDTGVPFLSVNNISDNKIDLSSLRYISKEDDLEFSKKCKPRLHDILLGKAASVGKVAIVENDFDFNIWSPLAMIRVNNNYNPFFIFYCFQTSNILEQITLLTNSSSQGNIGMGDIEKILVPILDISLQNELASRLRDFDKKTESLSRLVTKYEWLKQGMMNDLITGKVRLV